VNDASELPTDLTGTVGVTAGASAPDELVDEIVRALEPVLGTEEVRVTVEDEYFPPPPELRELLRGLAGALQLGLGAPSSGDRVDRSGPFSTDRESSAAEVLAVLAG
jgi:4-hydroxy-3-methylbut-2-enyl diphosphate reductase